MCDSPSREKGGSGEDDDGGASDDNSYCEQRYASLHKLEAEGMSLFPHKFDVSISFQDFQQKYKGLEVGEQRKEESVSMAGRLFSIRRSGKNLVFLDVRADGARVQFMCNRKAFQGDWELMLEQTIKRGDLIGAKGFPVRNQKGELCLMPRESIQLLAPCLRQMPTEHFGLKDPALKYRNRHVDLLVSPNVRGVFEGRATILRTIRSFLDARSFLEVETPILAREASGAAARPFHTFHNDLKSTLTLRVAPELYLKRLIVGGLDRVYEVGKNFRNEGMDATHNPEFTSVELYQAYADYQDLIPLTEELLREVCIKVHGESSVQIAGREGQEAVTLDFGSPFKQLDYVGSLELATGQSFPDPTELHTPDSLRFLRGVAEKQGVPVEGIAAAGPLLDKLLGALVEPECVQPTLIMHHPLCMSPLAKEHRSRPGLTERFELFVLRKELVNAYTELNDPREQRQRFEGQAVQKAGGDEEAMGVDASFVDALEFGLPPTAGWGIGVDRLCMTLLDAPSIRDVLLFPMLRLETDARPGARDQDASADAPKP